MAKEITTTFICDRCGKRETKDERYCPHPSGYVSFGPANGSNDEHIGERANKQKQHADICEPGRRWEVRTRCREPSGRARGSGNRKEAYNPVVPLPSIRECSRV